MPCLKSTANHIKAINNELDKAKQKYKLKEDIKHRKKGVGLGKHKTDRWEKKNTYKNKMKD